MTEPDKYLTCARRGQWRRWLEEHHAAEKEVYLVIFRKKYAQSGLSLEEAVEEALCFGWIDSTLKPIDERRYTLRFSPRTANSIWSMRNIRRAEKLAADGKMADAGRKKIAEAQENGQWQAALRRERVDELPSELEEALRKAEGAAPAFRKLPDSMKKRYIYCVESAKRDDTRRRRARRITDEILKR